MNPNAVQYIGFIVAALILSWGAIELNRRRRRKANIGSLNTWVKLDTRRAADADDPEEALPVDDADEQEDDEQAESSIQTRAKQNGHHSESKKLL
jgi:hypothetical protein